MQLTRCFRTSLMLQWGWNLGGTVISEQHIRDLCLRVSRASTEQEVCEALIELRRDLRVHVQETHNLALHMILSKLKTSAKISMEDETGSVAAHPVAQE